MIFAINKIVKIRKKRFGVSPVIAEIMLIGMVVLAASIVITIGFITITTKASLQLNIVSIENWRLESKNLSTKYDTFDIIVENPGTRVIKLESSKFELKNESMSNKLSSWLMESDVILIPNQQIIIKISTVDNFEWVARGDNVIIELTAIAEDEPVISATTISQSLGTMIKVEESIDGPMSIVLNTTTNLTLPLADTASIDIENYGGNPINYTIDIFSSNASLNLSLQNSIGENLPFLFDINGSLASASVLSPSDTTLGQTIFLTVNSAPVGTTFVYIWLKVGSKILDSKILPINA